MWLLFSAVIFCPVYSIDWCSLPCDKGQHTMCKYKKLSKTNNCEDIKDIQTDLGRKELLRLHNEYRNKFANGQMGWDKAANMRRMSYDRDLETVALRWAVQCVGGHDECRSTKDFAKVGQNYYRQGSSEPFSSDQSDGGFNSWVDEIKIAPKNIVKSYQFGSGYGHFTQVVWAETFKLGCAKVGYKSGSFFNIVIVCNYGPAGNFLGSPMYLTGDACSTCPEGTKCYGDSPYKHLCALPTDSSARSNQMRLNGKIVLEWERIMGLFFHIILLLRSNE